MAKRNHTQQIKYEQHVDRVSKEEKEAYRELSQAREILKMYRQKGIDISRKVEIWQAESREAKYANSITSKYRHIMSFAEPLKIIERKKNSNPKMLEFRSEVINGRIDLPLIKAALQRKDFENPLVLKSFRKWEASLLLFKKEE